MKGNNRSRGRTKQLSDSEKRPLSVDVPRSKRVVYPGHEADLATERERQLTTVRADQTTGLTNGRAANWAPEVVFSPFRALSRRQLTFPSCC